MQLLTSERLDAIRKDPHYAAYNAALIRAADAVLDRPIEVLSYRNHMYFYRSGMRDDRVKTARRKSLTALVFAYLLTEDSRYLECAEDYIWAICDEFAWAIPAHLKVEGMANAVPFETQPQYIELYSSITAAMLAEIDALLEDKLAFRIRKRIRMEIDRRVFTPFETRLHNLFWENTVHNWASVCASNLGTAYIHIADRERTLAILPRLKHAIGCFLDGYDADGCCLEGLAYWNFGFGSFVRFADLLCRYTDGADDWFRDGKIREIARFAQWNAMPSGDAIDFADCHRNSRASLALLHFLASRYPDLALPSAASRSLDGEAERDSEFFEILRNYIWVRPECEGNLFERNFHHYFENAEWFIEKNARYTFVAKAGHNAEPYLRAYPDWRERYENRSDRNEPHNHNDVGHFIFYSGGERILTDLGAGTYYVDYFLPDRRYTYLPASSRGHSVPILGGAEQERDIYHTGRVLSVSDTRFEIELIGAYGKTAVKSAVRLFETDGTGVTLTDTFRADGETEVTERFMAASEPTVEDGCVRIGNGTLRYDPALVTPSLRTETYDADGKIAHIIDFTFTVKGECSLTFRLE